VGTGAPRAEKEDVWTHFPNQVEDGGRIVAGLANGVKHRVGIEQSAEAVAEDRLAVCDQNSDNLSQTGSATSRNMPATMFLLGAEVGSRNLPLGG
jgi:hypothetical protein